MMQTDYEKIRDDSLELAADAAKLACQNTMGDEEHSAFLIMSELIESHEKGNLTVMGMAGIITALALEIHKRDHA